MEYLLLGLALVWAIFLQRRVLAHRRAVRAVRESLGLGQTILRDSLPGASGPEWEAFCETANRLAAELHQLRLDRTDQFSQLEATLGSLQEAVLVVDNKNYILLANPSFRAMFTSGGEVVGERVELVMHSAAFLTYVEAVRAGSAKPRHEIDFVEGDRTLWVEATGTTIAPLGGGKTPCQLFVLHDITKQRRLEKMRKEFVANVSHELRTPLSMIKGYTETLVDGHQDMPIADRDRFLKTIQRHAERLHSLIEDLLVLSRLESPNPGLNPERCDIARLANTILSDYRTRPAAAGHTLHLIVPAGLPPVWADPLKITQLFENLIDNALKYTPAGSRIEIGATAMGDEIEVAVRDNGPGIPAADLPHIFERFYRVDKGRSREKGGTGLGLSIVKHIAQLHGGRVRAESRAGQGTAFFFTLPVANTPSEAENAPSLRD